MVLKRIHYLKSSKNFNLRAGKSKEINLSLNECKATENTMIVGRVLQGLNPLSDAIVIVMDKDFRELYKAYCDTNGIFLFKETVPKGSYKIIAYCKGYTPSEAQNIVVEDSKVLKVFFELSQDTSAHKGIVYGDVSNTDTKEPIANAKVYLTFKSRSIKSSDALTNTRGEYIIYNILPGDYMLQVETEGYEISTPINVKVSNKEIISVDIPLHPILLNLGSISGSLGLDKSSRNNITTFLYKIHGDSARLCEVQITSKDGIFVFSGLSPGTYRVTATIVTDGDFQREYVVK